MNTNTQAIPCPRAAEVPVVKPHTLMNVAWDTITDYITALCMGHGLEKCKPLMYVWRTVVCLFFMYLFVGAFISFCMMGLQLAQAPTDPTMTASAYALKMFGHGCEFFFGYLCGAPRVLFCKFIESLFGCNTMVSGIAFNISVIMFSIGLVVEIIRRYRKA